MAKKELNKNIELFERWEKFVNMGFFIDLSFDNDSSMYRIEIYPCKKEVIFPTFAINGEYSDANVAMEHALLKCEEIYDSIKDTPNYNEKIKQENGYYDLPF